MHGLLRLRTAARVHARQGEERPDHGRGTAGLDPRQQEPLHVRPAGRLRHRHRIHLGLPYILNDSNPKDPIKGWDKTWAYLKALGENIEYYPAGSAALIKEFGEGSRDMIASLTAFDINPRLGIVPKEAKITTLKGFHWVNEGHFWSVPKGVSNERLAVVLDLRTFVLTREQQAYTWDKGYFYPGPAVKDVPLEMAPPESQAAIKEFGRPEYDALIANNPHETPVEAALMVAAFKRWDEEIGGAKR